jgi:hypothetical protein
VLDVLTTILYVGCGVLAVLGLVATLAKRPLGSVHLIAAAVVELGVLVQSIAAVIGLVRGAEVEGLALFLAYLAFAIVVLPAGVLWAVGEPNRWSGAVLAVAALALAVTVLRMDAVWLSGPRG